MRMAKINLNTLARDITIEEGLAESVSIAQVKEIMKLTLEYLGDEWVTGNEVGVIQLIKDYTPEKE